MTTANTKPSATTIRVDREVYEWLQSKGETFRDSPNSVLRRLTNLDPALPTDNQSDCQTPSTFVEKVFDHYKDGDVRGTSNSCCSEPVIFNESDWLMRICMFGNVLQIEIRHERCW